MEQETETNTEYVVEALIDGRWTRVGSGFRDLAAAETMKGYTGTRSRVALPIRIFELTVTTVRTMKPVRGSAPAISGPAAKAVAAILADRPRMATDDVIYVLGERGIEVSGRTVRRVRQQLA